jgi:hypothetical protein
MEQHGFKIVIDHRGHHRTDITIYNASKISVYNEDFCFN